MFVSAFASSNYGVCGSAEQEILGGADPNADWLLPEFIPFWLMLYTASYYNKAVLTSPWEPCDRTTFHDRLGMKFKHCQVATECWTPWHCSC